MYIVEVMKWYLVKYSNLTKNECQIRNTRGKTESSILTGRKDNNNGKPQRLVRLQVISIPKELLFEEALQNQTQENIREIPQKF